MTLLKTQKRNRRVFASDWSGLVFVRRLVLQRHLYPITFIAISIGTVASKSGQQFIQAIVEYYPGIWLLNGVPVAIIAVVLELLGGVIFDFDVRAYRHVFRKLDEMVAEMEELRG